MQQIKLSKNKAPAVAQNFAINSKRYTRVKNGQPFRAVASDGCLYGNIPMDIGDEIVERGTDAKSTIKACEFIGGGLYKYRLG